MMIVTKENERLYLNNWNYNECRLMTALAKVIENYGGKVKSYPKAIISNRNTDDKPVTVTHTSYISFVMDDYYYYFQLDDNPLFPFYYQKSPIKNGKTYKTVYLTELPKEKWMYDCLLSADCCEADIKEIAHLLFNILCKAKSCDIVVKRKKVHVPNTYNDGYHYETVVIGETDREIDF